MRSLNRESDIIQTIEGSFKRGEISRNDTIHLVDITTRLMNYLYSKYSNVKEVENMLYDQSLDLITDKLTDRIEELENVIAEKDKEFEDRIAEKDKEINDKDKALDESKALISALQKELESLKKA